MRTINALIPSPSVLLACAALAACASAPPVQPAPPPSAVVAPPQVISFADEASRYYASLGALHATELGSEYEVVNQRFLKNGNDLDRVKLAILLSLPDTPFHDTAAARALLNNWPGEAAQHDFARLLDMLLAGQQRAETASSDLSQSLAAEKAHSKSLQGKIDAIKNLEINPGRKEQP